MERTMLDKLAEWIRTHDGVVSCYANNTNGYVAVETSWIKPETREEGTEWNQIRTMSQARALLGY